MVESGCQEWHTQRIRFKLKVVPEKRWVVAVEVFGTIGKYPFEIDPWQPDQEYVRGRYDQYYQERAPARRRRLCDALLLKRGMQIGDSNVFLFTPWGTV